MTSTSVTRGFGIGGKTREDARTIARGRSRRVLNESAPVVVVTGANAGLGVETAEAAVRDGNVLVMAVRDVSRGERARRRS